MKNRLSKNYLFRKKLASIGITGGAVFSVSGFFGAPL
jgi:hypothetical protein